MKLAKMNFNKLDPLAIGESQFSLRAPRLDDAGELVASVGNFDVSKMLEKVPHPCPKEAVIGWIETALARRANGFGLEFVIAAANDNPAGVVGLSPFGKTAELGYWLCPDAQGAGLMTKAAYAAVGLAFEHGVDEVKSGAFADNPGSLRVQQKLGFNVVGETYVYCVSRRSKVRHINTVLTQQNFHKAA